MSTLLRGIAAALVASLAWSAAAFAETVEVVPGVRLTKRSFNVPINEQPFYGFVEKSEALKTADDTFRAAALKAVGTPEKAFEYSIRRGWDGVHAGDFALAARRFNQASLFARESSSLYHSFAVIAQAHLKDPVYAEELFKIALTRPGPLKGLRADYGRLLLILKRPAEALPLLEQAVIDGPDLSSAWNNLGFARLFAGKREGACEAATEAARLPNAPTKDIEILRSAAKCSDRM